MFLCNDIHLRFDVFFLVVVVAVSSSSRLSLSLLTLSLSILAAFRRSNSLCLNMAIESDWRRERRKQEICETEILKSVFVTIYTLYSLRETHKFQSTNTPHISIKLNVWFYKSRTNLNKYIPYPTLIYIRVSNPCISTTAGYMQRDKSKTMTSNPLSPVRPARKSTNHIQLHSRLLHHRNNTSAEHGLCSRYQVRPHP